ncbi:DNA primase [Streptomyces sp. NPDC051104]|uniref:DNA primase n=1 Tax=Streptomyces sp. NPDC051104 TaxID=3155044 RepID=UPI00341C1383
MNRTGLGLAVGAGYFLGRTKKLKLALAVGSLVAGKKLDLGPRMLANVVNQQLMNNPQFKEIGAQLRQDLRGVGKAATGAMVERRMNALADRLHDRTAQMRDELPEAGSGEGRDEDGDRAEREDDDRAEREDDDRAEREDDDRAEREDDDRAEREGGDRLPRGDSDRESRREKPSGKKAAKKAPGKKAAAKRTAPAKKAVGGSAGAARRTAAKKTAGARGAGSSKGGDDR